MDTLLRAPKFWVAAVALAMAFVMLNSYVATMDEMVEPHRPLFMTPAVSQQYAYSMEQYRQSKADTTSRYSIYAGILVAATLLGWMLTPPIQWKKEGGL